ncbi:alpha-glucan family phosphorylase [Egibacter rhizosphaerae]|uniref:Alpha-glucan family phosphorylase n=1 Tax=Egibacter rhizosphaerae TaxID=1670831 RepID=A0A411YAJ2_9ACTN|nr:alpha-glucan family phosphorylase [Egibacter rhizosphaerae]QBI18197.1 alpha-glucan family phosphorylase [Egibacter rhizosphaerae]
MTKQDEQVPPTKALSTFRVNPSLPEQLEPLTGLAYNLRWAWDAPTRELFQRADPQAWLDSGHNPVAVLARLGHQRMQELASDADFLADLERRRAALQRYLTEERWAQQEDPPPPAVAYFSPEFGLTAGMQVYSGGLGVLAGDHLKAASDLGLDLVGVGLLYRHGYFRQYLDHDGWQHEQYPDLNPHDLPLTRLERGGAPVTVEVELAERTVGCAIWRGEVGRIPLLLLDTDLEENDPSDRPITDKLYGGDREHRLRQEIVLGVAGVRALRRARELGEVPFEPIVYHSNEGHAALLQVERVRELVVEEGLEFDEAVQAARAPVLFTTHTPVPAGIDVFERDLAARYLAPMADACGVDTDRMLALGRHHGDEFNMAVLALRLSSAANGVSRLHGHVARDLFDDLWPELPAAEVPITSVTNGVHGSTWIGPEMTSVYDRHLPADWRSDPDAFAVAAKIDDEVIWQARQRERERLVTSVRERVRHQRERRGEPAYGLGWTEEVLDPDALTIGFARRFAQYKRGTLLLRQPERLRELLLSPERPVQLVFAGKAHPRDDGGKDLIRQLVHFGADPAIRDRFVFLEDYDMDLAAALYHGVDVWLNTPRRPYEACGTSGEKAALNGVLNCSILDGWWDEMADAENGFSIGTRETHPPEEQDALDAEALFDTLEHGVVPTFYERRDGSIPRRWVGMIRHSIASLGPRVLASRMVREYVTELYAPVAARAEGLIAEGYRGARELARWKQRVQEAWPAVRVTDVRTDPGEADLGDRRELRVQVELGPLSPDDIAVELLHGSVDADGTISAPARQSLELVERHDGTADFAGSFAVRDVGEYGYAVRALPDHTGLASRAELGLARFAAPEAAGDEVGPEESGEPVWEAST